jgi:uncharacterized protein YukE
MGIKFSNAGTAFAGVAKTIFPGLFISIIGGSFAFWMFNNPEKIRGKATLRAWESIKQYERLYIDNTDMINCGIAENGVERFKSNMIHQIQMTSENLKNVLDKENNVDNLMLAVINMKIDSYNEMKKLTGTLLDTLQSIDDTGAGSEKELEQLARRWIGVHSKYMDECAFLKNRDTTTVNKILKELNKNYSINFTEDNFLPDTANLRKKIIGTWTIALYKVSFEFKQDGTGYWNAMEKNISCTWQLDSTMIKVKYSDGSGVLNFSVIKTNNDILTIRQEGGEIKNNSYIACRLH